VATRAVSEALVSGEFWGLEEERDEKLVSEFHFFFALSNVGG
jgi:hypothetical protein